MDIYGIVAVSFPYQLSFEVSVDGQWMAKLVRDIVSGATQPVEVETNAGVAGLALNGTGIVVGHSHGQPLDSIGSLASVSIFFPRTEYAIGMGEAPNSVGVYGMDIVCQKKTAGCSVDVQNGRDADYNTTNDGYLSKYVFATAGSDSMFSWDGEQYKFGLFAHAVAQNPVATVLGSTMSVVILGPDSFRDRREPLRDTMAGRRLSGVPDDCSVQICYHIDIFVDAPSKSSTSKNSTNATSANTTSTNSTATSTNATAPTLEGGAPISISLCGKMDDFNNVLVDFGIDAFRSSENRYAHVFLAETEYVGALTSTNDTQTSTNGTVAVNAAVQFLDSSILSASSTSAYTCSESDNGLFVDFTHSGEIALGGNVYLDLEADLELSTTTEATSLTFTGVLASDSFEIGFNDSITGNNTIWEHAAVMSFNDGGHTDWTLQLMSNATLTGETLFSDHLWVLDTRSPTPAQLVSMSHVNFMSADQVVQIVTSVTNGTSGVTTFEASVEASSLQTGNLTTTAVMGAVKAEGHFDVAATHTCKWGLSSELWDSLGIGFSCDQTFEYDFGSVSGGFIDQRMDAFVDSTVLLISHEHWEDELVSNFTLWDVATAECNNSRNELFIFANASNAPGEIDVSIVSTIEVGQQSWFYGAGGFVSAHNATAHYGDVNITSTAVLNAAVGDRVIILSSDTLVSQSAEYLSTRLDHVIGYPQHGTWSNDFKMSVTNNEKELVFAESTGTVNTGLVSNLSNSRSGVAVHQVTLVRAHNFTAETVHRQNALVMVGDTLLHLTSETEVDGVVVGNCTFTDTVVRHESNFVSDARFVLRDEVTDHPCVVDLDLHSIVPDPNKTSSGNSTEFFTAHTLDMKLREGTRLNGSRTYMTRHFSSSGALQLGSYDNGTSTQHSAFSVLEDGVETISMSSSLIARSGLSSNLDPSLSGVSVEHVATIQLDNGTSVTEHKQHVVMLSEDVVLTLMALSTHDDALVQRISFTDSGMFQGSTFINNMHIFAQDDVEQLPVLFDFDLMTHFSKNMPTSNDWGNASYTAMAHDASFDLRYGTRSNGTREFELQKYVANCTYDWATNDTGTFNHNGALSISIEDYELIHLDSTSAARFVPNPEQSFRGLKFDNRIDLRLQNGTANMTHEHKVAVLADNALLNFDALTTVGDIMLHQVSFSDSVLVQDNGAVVNSIHMTLKDSVANSPVVDAELSSTFSNATYFSDELGNVARMSVTNNALVKWRDGIRSNHTRAYTTHTYVSNTTLDFSTSSSGTMSHDVTFGLLKDSYELLYVSSASDVRSGTESNLALPLNVSVSGVSIDHLLTVRMENGTARSIQEHHAAFLADDTLVELRTQNSFNDVLTNTFFFSDSVTLQNDGGVNEIRIAVLDDVVTVPIVFALNLTSTFATGLMSNIADGAVGVRMQHDAVLRVRDGVRLNNSRTYGLQRYSAETSIDVLTDDDVLAVVSTISLFNQPVIVVDAACAHYSMGVHSSAAMTMVNANVRYWDYELFDLDAQFSTEWDNSTALVAFYNTTLPGFRTSQTLSLLTHNGTSNYTLTEQQELLMDNTLLHIRHTEVSDGELLTSWAVSDFVTVDGANAVVENRCEFWKADGVSNVNILEVTLNSRVRHSRWSNFWQSHSGVNMQHELDISRRHVNRSHDYFLVTMTAASSTSIFVDDLALETNVSVSDFVGDTNTFMYSHIATMENNGSKLEQRVFSALHNIPEALEVFALEADVAVDWAGDSVFYMFGNGGLSAQQNVVLWTQNHTSNASATTNLSVVGERAAMDVNILAHNLNVTLVDTASLTTSLQNFLYFEVEDGRSAPLFQMGLVSTFVNATSNVFNGQGIRSTHNLDIRPRRVART